MTVKELVKYLYQYYNDTDKVLIDTTVDGGFVNARNLSQRDIQRVDRNTIIITPYY